MPISTVTLSLDTNTAVNALIVDKQILIMT